MLTVKQAADACGLTILTAASPLDREVKGLFCCDLLSWAMSRAPADYAWVTVMGNLNAVAVASLADSACIVLAEDAAIDDTSLERASQQGVTVLRSSQPAFETALAIHRLLEQ